MQWIQHGLAGAGIVLMAGGLAHAGMVIEPNADTAVPAFGASADANGFETEAVPTILEFNAALLPATRAGHRPGGTLQMVVLDDDARRRWLDVQDRPDGLPDDLSAALAALKHDSLLGGGAWDGYWP